MRNGVDLSEKEIERFDELSASAREIVETATIRIQARIESLAAAQRWYATSLALYLEAIVLLSEDPLDSFDAAIEKSRKFEWVENQFDSSSLRLNFELREARKMSIGR